VVRFAPPLIITESEIDTALEIIGAAFDSLPAPGGIGKTIARAAA
jgi:acetylornithine/succinyldiaminopimelate/putrescine aminotransferase